MLNPHDFPELKAHPTFEFEDGLLSGLVAAQVALRAEHRKRRGPLMRSLALHSNRARALLSEGLGSEPPRLDLAACAVAALEDEALDLGRVLHTLDALGARVRALEPERLDALGRVAGAAAGPGRRGRASGGTPTPTTRPRTASSTRCWSGRRACPSPSPSSTSRSPGAPRVPLFGVSFPGHFLVACPSEDGKLVVDPFQGGKILTEAGCQDLLAKVAPQVRFQPRLLSPAPAKVIVWRMLNNVKRAWLERTQGERAARAVDLLLQLHPDHPGELRARATILSALGAYRAALADVERCLELSPDAPDQAQLELTAQALRHRLEFLN